MGAYDAPKGPVVLPALPNFKEDPTGAMTQNILFHWYLKVDPNRATPELIMPLLEMLERLNNAARKQVEKTARVSHSRGSGIEVSYTPQQQQVLTGLDRFSKRLADYMVVTSVALEGRENDRPATAGLVVAPLLLGRWDAFDELPQGISVGVDDQGIADVGTLFRLAHQSRVEVKARKDNWERFKKDLQKNLKDIVKIVIPPLPELKTLVWAGMAIVAGAVILPRVFGNDGSDD